MDFIMNFINYPKTIHIPTSKEVDIDYISSSLLPLLSCDSHQSIIIEEKMDGVGIGIGFCHCLPYIQQRGHIYSLHNLPHYLTELKTWILQKEELLYQLIGEDYIIFGEWLYHKHTVFYDNLPDYFLEYDLYDKQNQYFLSTEQRHRMISSVNQLSDDKIHSVYVIKEINQLTVKELSQLIQQHPFSQFKSLGISSCFEKHIQYQQQVENIKKHTLVDLSYEGFYIKIENEHSVDNRYKWIRKLFMDYLLMGEHWKNRPLISNQTILKRK